MLVERCKVIPQVSSWVTKIHGEFEVLYENMINEIKRKTQKNPK